MEFKDDGKQKQPKPEPSVAPQKIILFPSTRIPSPTQNPPRISTGIRHQKTTSTPGSPLQPKRGPITGNPNEMERGGQISDGPGRAATILLLLTFAIIIFPLVVLVALVFLLLHYT